MAGGERDVQALKLRELASNKRVCVNRRCQRCGNAGNDAINDKGNIGGESLVVVDPLEVLRKRRKAESRARNEALLESVRKHETECLAAGVEVFVVSLGMIARHGRGPVVMDGASVGAGS